MSGITERARFRIETIVADAEYRDAQSAIADAANVGLLASHPELAKERDAARAAAVRDANSARGAGAAPQRTASLVHRVLSIFAIVLGAGAVALVALSPRSGAGAFSLQSGAFAAGIVALVAAAIMVWLEPLRRSGELWGSHLPARINLFFAVLWIGFAATIVIFRWSEVDRFEPWPVILGLLFFVAAGVAVLLLWVGGRKADRSGVQTGRSHLLRGLADEADAPRVFEALDRWWAVAGPRAAAADGEKLLAARREVLAYLARAGMIDPDQQNRAAQSVTFGEWKERRP